MWMRSSWARGTSSRLIAAGSTLGSLAALWLLDEQLGVGQCAQWLVDDYRGMLRTVHHQVVSPTLTEPINVTLNALTRPPPIGCLEWPAGRVLLQWCLDCLPLRNATILEIGSGIGTTPRSDWPSPTTASAPHAEWLLPMRTTKSLTCSVPTPR